MISKWLCSVGAMNRKKRDVSFKHRPEIGKRMIEIAQDWENGIGIKNIADLKYNNFETFKFIYERYTRKPYDNLEFPTNFADIRKFKMGIKYFNKSLEKPRGFFARNFHIPQTTLQKFPEMAKFEWAVNRENSYYRSFTIESTKRTNDMLSTFKELAGSFGKKIKTYTGIGKDGLTEFQRLEREYDTIVSQIKKIKDVNDPRLDVLGDKLNANRDQIVRFYETGSGEAIKMINSVLSGADPESVTTSDGRPIANSQKILLNRIRKDWVDVRRMSVKSLIRALEKIAQNAKNKNLTWADGTITHIKGLIKAIEFQETRDTSGRLIAYKDLQPVRDFIELGFEGNQTSNNKVAFSPHYMAHYTLGLVKTIKNLEYRIENSELDVGQKLQRELGEWDNIVNIAKGRSEIINPMYHADPYFFLKRYTSDVAQFNYSTHVKSTLNDAVNTIITRHINPAKQKGREDLAEVGWDMLNVMKDVYRDIRTNKEINIKENHIDDLSRIMTSFTYFHLMGGNARSAARNSTQRFLEWVNFGFKATVWDAKRFYSESGKSSLNISAYERQSKQYGLQLYSGKTIKRSLWESVIGENTKLSESSRGALEDAYIGNKDLYINEKGELTTNANWRFTAAIADKTSRAAQIAGGLHRLVEDYNRARTYKVAFALASQNLTNTTDSFKIRQILTQGQKENILSIKGKDHQFNREDLVDIHGEKTDKVIDNWVEKKAGQIAYNGTLDVHFEYAKWNKANAIKATDDDGRAVAFVKVGLGQFSHYRFNMIRLMHRWIGEGLISARALDFTSPEVGRPLKYGMLQAAIWTATMSFNTNFRKLMPNELGDYGEAMWTWMSSNRERLVNAENGEWLGDLSPETQKLLNKKTYGQGGWYFLGPNIGIGLDAYELFAHYTGFKNLTNGSKDPTASMVFEKSLNESNIKDERVETYNKLAWLNHQVARSVAYTWPLMTNSNADLTTIAKFELGLFMDPQSKETAKWWRGEVLGWGKKKRHGKKKLIKKTTPEYDKDAILRSLTRF